SPSVPPLSQSSRAANGSTGYPRATRVRCAASGALCCQRPSIRNCSGPALASPAGLTGHWMPARGEIDRLERHLASVLEMALSRVILESGETRPAATDYYRQYGGFHRGGRRVVYVNGLHQKIVQIRESPSWTEEPFGLCDGGFMGFGVVYDVDADKFESVEFDGRYSGRVKTK